VTRRRASLPHLPQAPATPSKSPPGIQASNPDFAYIASCPTENVGIVLAANEIGLKNEVGRGRHVGLQYAAIKTQLGELFNKIRAWERCCCAGDCLPNGPASAKSLASPVLQPFHRTERGRGRIKPANDRLRPADRNRAEKGREPVIEPNQQTAIGIVEVRSFRRLPPKDVDLLAQDQNFRLQPRSRLEERCQDAKNQLERLDHRAARLPHLCLALSRIVFWYTQAKSRTSHEQADKQQVLA
jgi:hypothetical protein